MIASNYRKHPEALALQLPLPFGRALNAPFNDGFIGQKRSQGTEENAQEYDEESANECAFTVFNFSTKHAAPSPLWERCYQGG